MQSFRIFLIKTGPMFVCTAAGAEVLAVCVAKIKWQLSTVKAI